MKQTIEAIYEKGLLRPLRKLSFKDGDHVTLSLDEPSSSDPNEENKQAVTYDFSDLCGTISYTDNTVAAQRNLRDEWE